MSGPISVNRPTYIRMATTSFLMGGVAVSAGVLFGLLDYLALFAVMLTSIFVLLLLGYMAWRQVRRNQDRVGGLGCVSLALIGILFVILLPAIEPTRPSALRVQSVSKLKQIGLALYDYQQEHGRFPPAVVYSSEGRPLYNWRVLILPYMEQKDLYAKFDLNEAWDGPHNRELLAQRPVVYGPSGIAVESSLTFYQAFVGAGTAFEDRRGTTLKDFPDGLSKTAMVVEAREPVPWTKPIDLPYMEVAQLPQLGGGVFTPSPRPFVAGNIDGFNALFADGSVHYIHLGRVKESILRALITRKGNEPISFDDF